MSIDHVEGHSLEWQRAELSMWLPNIDNTVQAWINEHRHKIPALSLQRLDEGHGVYGDSSFWKRAALLEGEMFEEVADLFTYAALRKRAQAAETPA